MRQAALLWRCKDIFQDGIEQDAFQELLSNVITSRVDDRKSFLSSKALKHRITKSIQADGMVDIHHFLEQHVGFSTSDIEHEMWDLVLYRKYLSSRKLQSKEVQEVSSCVNAASLCTCCGQSSESLHHRIPILTIAPCPVHV